MRVAGSTAAKRAAMNDPGDRLVVAASASEETPRGAPPAEQTIAQLEAAPTAVADWLDDGGRGKP
jgi:hypothetical protein